MWLGRYRAGKTEDVGIAERFRAESRSKRIADHSTNTGVCAAVRFDRARMIVRFDFEDHMVLVIEFDDACVIFENAHAPIVLAKLAADRLSGLKDGLFQHVLELTLALLVFIGDATGQRLVAAVFAPGLRDRLEFDIRRLASSVLEVLLNSLHLSKRQIELPSATERHQLIIAERPDRDRRQLVLICGANIDAIEVERSDDDAFDRNR